MSGPFTEAHQFKGVFPPADDVARANRPGTPPELREALLKKPAFTQDVSLKFSDGTMFAIQEDDAGQYLVLEPVRGVRPRVNIGDWIVKMPNGSFMALTDDNYRAMGGT
jgi:hypothetical protein